MCNSSINSNLRSLLDELERIKFNDLSRTLELSNETYFQCKMQQYPAGMCFSLLVKGNCLSFLGKYSDAIHSLSQAINLAIENNICDLQILINIAIGNIFSDLSNYEEGFSFYNSAVKLCSKLSNSTNYYSNSCYEIYYCKVCNNMAEIYKILGDLDNASRLYNQAVELDIKTNYKGTLGVSIANLGSLNLLKGNLYEAKKQILKGLEITKANNFSIAITECYTNLAMIYEKEHNEDKAKLYFQKAMNFSENSSGVFYKLGAIINYSKFLKKHGDIALAIDNLISALNIAETNNLLEKCNSVCKELANCYEELNDIEKSNKYYRLYFKFDSELKVLSNSQILTSIEIKLKLDTLESERQKLIKKNDDYRKHSEMLLESSRKMKILSELGQKLTSTQNLDEIIDILSSNISEFMNIHNFSLALYDKDKDCLIFKCNNTNGSNSELPLVQLNNNRSLSAYCVRANKFIVINDFDKDPLVLNETINIYEPNGMHGFQSAIYCPLLIDGYSFGMISIYSHIKNRFNTLDIETMRALASYAAIAINNSLKSSYLKIEIANKEKIQKDLEKVNYELKYLSENDFLTKLSNRRKFNSTLLIEWQNCLQKKCPLSIIIFDVDNFKELNDNYGHLVGDKCLAKIASVFKDCMNDTYTPSRFGGDEFIAILPGISKDKAIQIGKKISSAVKALKIEHAFSKTDNIVTISVGVASVIPTESTSIDELLKSADTAMYKSKMAREKLFNSTKGL
ncbi:diguanylate cyclase domain-containing protein [Clostridium oryzae]|uniref:Phytochrome-like protein cph2 n=1 Tax=Clostridium oryzae TaxID=1450648 RepID=A0A1V4ID18_9CLOT|nr:diguanylate cyclase [Clostridium oryzae]OPJ57836.1 phytochrome-like protein cph2 [Clostridium oryzae]